MEEPTRDTEIQDPGSVEEKVDDTAGDITTEDSEQVAEETLPQDGEKQPPVESEQQLEEEEEQLDLQQQLQEMQAKIDHSNKVAEFYQTAYNNEMRRQEQPNRQVAPEKAKDGTTEEAIKQPGEWEDQAQMASYIDNTINEFSSPILERLDAKLTAYEDMLLKLSHPDFEEYTKDWKDELFLTGPNGELIDTKNQALLSFFQAQPIPRLAAYEWAKARRSPEKIKTARKKGKNDILRELAKKPKGPTKVDGGGVDQQVQELGFDTPPEIADGILADRGVIPRKK